MSRDFPAYLFGGRLRTSTLVLIVAFIAVWWLYETYQPAAEPAPQVPASEVVPPGFIPDPSYTWVPRTDVQRPTTASSPATTALTTSPTTSPTAAPTVPTSPTSAEGAPEPGPDNPAPPAEPPPPPGPAAPPP